jgi:hypothetical protein
MRSIFPIIFIALSVIIFFFVLRPLYKDVSALRSDTEAYNVALSHSTDLQKVRDTLAGKYSNITNVDKTRLSRFLPNTVDNIQLILELEQMAGKHGLSLKNISFAPPQNGTDDKSSPQNSGANQKPYGIFNLEFKTQATYETFVLFLKDLELNLRLIDVKGISFSINNNQKPADTDPLSYENSVKIQTYWLKY